MQPTVFPVLGVPTPPTDPTRSQEDERQDYLVKRLGPQEAARWYLHTATSYRAAMINAVIGTSGTLGNDWAQVYCHAKNDCESRAQSLGRTIH